MFGRLIRRDAKTRAIASALYGAIVAQARSPALYSDFGVADTVEGRFEMVVLHTVLIIDRLGQGGDAEKAVAQKVFDLHCTDMDRSLRELGIGDLGVPKRMKKMAESFYGRAGAYRAALATHDVPALAAAIARNVFPDGAAGAGAERLARYAMESALSLRQYKIGDVVAFADPSRFLREDTAA
jgi:cytochrome b pre-mRNA-processing protein 3